MTGDPGTITLVLVAVAASFTLSASAGMGGSLILVPVLSLLLGVKEGVALAALLLAGNNVVKVLAYRSTLPWRRSAQVIVLLVVGALVGAMLLAAAPPEVVAVGVVAAIVGSFVAEGAALERLQAAGGPLLAFAAGATSGFSGTSGPLKGVALRNLRLDRHHLVGAASLASLFGDVAKSAVFAEAGLLGSNAMVVVAVAVPLMLASTLTGRRLNRAIGEYGYRTLFWAVMAGYSVRLAAPLL